MPDLIREHEDTAAANTACWVAVLLLFALLIPAAISHADDSMREATWHAVPAPDQSDWSGKRLSRYAALDRASLGEPLAVIRVPALAVAAQIYSDTHTQSLEAGAAWVSATTRPGEAGNIAIAGHRDSFFRPLEDIPIGTQITLTTAEGEQLFAVASIEIVDPLNTSPLAPTETTTLTLITCHPFSYQGFAPDRYIIRAELIEESITHAGLAESAMRTTTAN